MATSQGCRSSKDGSVGVSPSGEASRNVRRPGTGLREPENTSLAAQNIESDVAPAPTLDEAEREIVGWLREESPRLVWGTMKDCPTPSLREFRDEIAKDAQFCGPVTRAEKLRRIACADLVIANRQENQQ